VEDWAAVVVGAVVGGEEEMVVGVVGVRGGCCDAFMLVEARGRGGCVKVLEVMVGMTVNAVTCVRIRGRPAACMLASKMGASRERIFEGGEV